MSAPRDKQRKTTDRRIKHCKICGNDYHPSKSQLVDLCALCTAATEKFKTTDAYKEFQELSKKDHSSDYKANPHIGSDFDDWYQEDIETGQDEDYNLIKERLQQRNQAIPVDLAALFKEGIDKHEKTMNELKQHEQTEGNRDVSGKPPRHYFYTEGLQEYLRILEKPAHANLVNNIEQLLKELKDNASLEPARNQVAWILIDIKMLYGPKLLQDVSYVVKMGAEKYGHSNYKKGMRFSYCISSFMGHLLSHAQGQELDDESGHNHLLHCVANMLLLLGYLTDGNLVERFNDIHEMFT